MGRKIMSLKWLITADCTPSDWDGRHAAERLQRQHHVRTGVDGVVDVLADLEVAFAAAGERL